MTDNQENRKEMASGFSGLKAERRALKLSAVFSKGDCAHGAQEHPTGIVQGALEDKSQNILQ